MMHRGHYRCQKNMEYGLLTSCWYELFHVPTAKSGVRGLGLVGGEFNMECSNIIIG
jgi:hypothetical protein